MRAYLRTYQAGGALSPAFSPTAESMDDAAHESGNALAPTSARLAQTSTGAPCPGDRAEVFHAAGAHVFAPPGVALSARGDDPVPGRQGIENFAQKLITPSSAIVFRHT